MKHYLIAGNWKMHTVRAEAVDLAARVAQATLEHTGSGKVDVAVCPPFVYLEKIAGVVNASPVGLGAQNMHHEAKGAFTGEISAAMLVDLGCRYVILGHSERRNLFHENDLGVFTKAQAALAAGLEPIVCVGEQLADREAGNTAKVIAGQFEGSLSGLSPEQIARVVIAYEPVWAIGTGKTATPDQAQEVHRDLRKLLEDRYNSEIAAGIRILYGGSVKPDNAGELLSQPDVDGALVGGACLKAADFSSIIQTANGLA